MSRTYRKPAWYVKRSDVQEINREIAQRNKHLYFGFYYAGVRQRKPKKQYEEEVRKAQEKCDREIENARELGKPTYTLDIRQTYDCNRVPRIRWEFYKKPLYTPAFISRYVYIKKPLDYNDIVEEVMEERHRLQRDGNMSETGRRTGFKKDAASTVRRANKNFCYKVMKGEWENDPYPIRKQGKTLAWDYW